MSSLCPSQGPGSTRVRRQSVALAPRRHGMAETLTNQPDPLLFSWKDKGWGCAFPAGAHACAHTHTRQPRGLGARSCWA